MNTTREEWLIAKSLEYAAISANSADCAGGEEKELTTKQRESIVKEVASHISRYQADSLYEFAKSISELKDQEAEEFRQLKCTRE